MIPYYYRPFSLGSYLYINKNLNEYDVFLKVLNIIKELYDNGIIYVDIKSDNIVIKDNIFHLIDFDERYVKFRDSKYQYMHLKHLLSNFKYMIEFLTRDEVKKIIPDLKYVETLEQLEEELEIGKAKIKK